MSSPAQTIQFEQHLNALPAQVYTAFTNATALREWLCDIATVNPRCGGRVYLWWNSGYYTSGEYTDLEPEERVVFTWQGRGDPAPSLVDVKLKAMDGGTHLTLTHSKIGTGEEWADTAREIQHDWPRALENLESVLESGQDLRITRRPMLGIGINDFNSEIAQQMGVPVGEGIRIDGTVEGMGAQAAGLMKDDVIVGMAGHTITNYPNLAVALQSKRAGDCIEVVYYRGPEKKTVMMELSKRPMPEIPELPDQLAEALRKEYANQFAALRQCFEGVSETEADHRPAGGEWNAKEIVAHLILGERDNQAFIASIMAGQEQWADDFAGNSHERTRAVVKVYPTIAEILEELRRSFDETIALASDFPAEFVQRKGSYWRIASNLLQSNTHALGHLEQIKAAIGSARNLNGLLQS